MEAEIFFWKKTATRLSFVLRGWVKDQQEDRSLEGIEIRLSGIRDWSRPRNKICPSCWRRPSVNECTEGRMKAKIGGFPWMRTETIIANNLMKIIAVVKKPQIYGGWIFWGRGRICQVEGRVSSSKFGLLSERFCARRKGREASLSRPSSFCSLGEDWSPNSLWTGRP